MKPPQANSALPPIVQIIPGLHLNAFRGEPAISVFDWHFTPPHSSSERFVTHTGAALHVRLGTLQPDHGELTRFRVYPPRPLVALFRRAFAAAPAVAALTRPRGVTRRVILQKARRQGTSPLRLHVGRRFQGLFHSPRRGAFHRSLTVLCAIGSVVYLALGGGPPSFPPGSSCLAVLRNIEHGAWNYLYPAVTVCGGVFQTPSSHTQAARGSPGRETVPYPATPTQQRLPPWHCMSLGKTPVRSPLLRGCCLFLWLHEMFQLARCPPANKCRYPHEVGGLPH